MTDLSDLSLSPEEMIARARGRGSELEALQAENARLRQVVDGLREKALTIQDRYSNEENHFLTTTELLAALEDKP